MPTKPTYIKLPIYSIGTFNEYFYVSGGGGGKTGIKNQILVYKYKIDQNEPAARIQTGSSIVQNMHVCPDRKILIASTSSNIVIYNVQNNGLQLAEKTHFRADFAQKNSTIFQYSLSYHTKRNLLITAGQDLIIRFFYLDQNFEVIKEKYFEHSHHSNPLKNVDNNGKNLVLSSCTNQIVVFDIETKKISKKIFNDQLLPQRSMFQSAHFISPQSDKLLICHYILRKAAYVTKESGSKFQTVQITKDQSCLTCYHKGWEVLGIACGNGSTYLVKASNLKTIGKDHNHAFVITGGTISRGGRFITGTPQCSYHIQRIVQPFFPCSWLPFLALLISILIIFLLSTDVVTSDISKTDL